MMIAGSVQPNGDAIVSLRLRGPRGYDARVEVVVDTGFNESLVLPSSVIRALGLEFRENTCCSLANGTTVNSLLYAVEVEWLGEWLPIVTGEMEGGALMGMQLMAGCHLTVHVVPGGLVEITKSE